MITSSETSKASGVRFPTLMHASCAAPNVVRGAGMRATGEGGRRWRRCQRSLIKLTLPANPLIKTACDDEAPIVRKLPAEFDQTSRRMPYVRKYPHAHFNLKCGPCSRRAFITRRGRGGWLDDERLHRRVRCQSKTSPLLLTLFSLRPTLCGCPYAPL